jgi:hypothetical protein
MREAWFEVIKRTGSGNRRKRTPAQQRAADKANARLRAKIDAESNLQGVTGRKDAIFDIKGKATPEKVAAKTKQEEKLNRQAQKEARRKEIKEGAKRAGEAIAGGAKKGWKKLLQAGKKGAKALNPNTYLPDPTATGTGKPVDLRAKDPFSGKPRFNRITTRENEEAKDTDRFKDEMSQFQQRASNEPKEEALTAEQERQRKKEARLNVASQAGQQAQLDRVAGDKAAEEAKAKEDYAAHEKKLEESRRKAEQQANLDARKELMAQQKEQAKAARDAKIKEMGEVNRQRAEAARKEANTTVMPKIEGLKPAPVKMQTPAALTGKNMINLNRQSQGKGNLTGPPPAPAPPKIDRKQMANAKKLEQVQQSNPNVFQQMVTNQKNWDKKKEEEAKAKEEAKKNPNAAPPQQTPVNTAPPPPQQPIRQPTQAELQMSQQNQQQRKQTQAALQGQVAGGQKRSAWQNVLQKPQAPPPKAPQGQSTALNQKQQAAMEMFNQVQANKRARQPQVIQ